MDFEEANRERERRSRTQTIRVGLMICSALILLDYVNAPAKGSSHSVSGNVGRPVPSPRYLSLNETNLVNQRFSSTGRIGNLSTVYRGTWTGVQHDEMSGPVSGSNSIKKSVSANVMLQLRMLPMDGSPNSVFVYGVMKLSGAGALSRGHSDGFLKDSYYPLQGVYLLRENILTAAVTPSRRNKIFLSTGTGALSDAQFQSSAAGEAPDPRFLTEQPEVGSADASVPNISVGSDLLGYILHSLGFAASILNTIRKDVYALGAASHIEVEQLGLSSIEAHTVSTEFLPIRRGLAKNSEFSLNTTNSIQLNSLIPQSTLTDNIKSSLTVLSSVPIGRTGIMLVSTRTGTSLPNGAAIGLGDYLLPDSFKSMQMQLGSSLDSSCSSTTVVKLQKIGDLVKSPGNLIVEKMAGSIISAGCQIQLNASLTEYHIDVVNLGSKVGTYSTLLMLVCSVQIYLLVLQMKHSEPQGSSARISMLSMGSQALLDAVLCVGHLLLSVAIPSVFFYYFMWIAILKLVIYSVLEMRMMIGIYRARNLQNAAINNAFALRRYLSVIHTRFFVALFAAMMTVNIFYDRPILLVFVFYSFWIPQIFLNAYEGTRQPFLPQFAIGMTISRLFIPLYVFGCPSNFLAELIGSSIVSFATCLALISWLCVQLLVLELQAKFGSRFFIPKRFLPISYDYRRPINGESTEMSPLHSLSDRNEVSFPRGRVAAGDIEEGDLKECVICYNSIDIDSKNYMITPCDHLFHEECLSRWMDVKLECPVCRAQLPPLVID